MSTSIHRVIKKLKWFNLSCIRLQMSYYGFNNLSELLTGHLDAKIGWGILSCDLIYIEYKISLPYNINGKCVYKVKYQKKCLIYEVKLSICHAIYIGKKQEIFKKRTDCHFSDLLRLLKIYKNHTHLLPIINITLNIICHVHTYISAWC